MRLKYYLRGLGAGIIVTALIMQFTPKTPEKMTDAEIKRRAAELGMVEEENMTLLDDNEPVGEDEPENGGMAPPADGVSRNQAMQDNVLQNNVSQNTVSAGRVSGNTVSAGRLTEGFVPGNSADGSAKGMPEIGTALDEAEDGQAGRSGKVASKLLSGNMVASAEGSARGTGRGSASGPAEEFATVVISTGQSSLSAANACRDAGLVEDASEFDLFLCGGGYDRILKVGSHRIKKGSSAEEIARALTGKTE